MHELVLTRKDKASRYEELLPQIRSLIAGETDLTANLANVSAALHEAFDFLWVGFYLVDDARNELVLGPFQGPVACTRIGYGKGVCGTAWKEGRSVVVEDVQAFPGHIACSQKSRSEIVVPVSDDGGHVLGVLDIDSVFLSAFDEVDRHYLEMLCRIICESAK
ncbi:MAG TPA: GAF domain-containing protein [Candidatus Coprenecus pullistercoris]|nr:GAF domain-containing protein [Candidatus Coprenecus pullistercoris]